MRAQFAVLLLISTVAGADDSFHLDDQRLFNTVDAYHLEPGDFRTEVQAFAGQPLTQPTLELRAEVGVREHVQLSFAEDMTQASGHAPTLSAAPISVRYSLGTIEDQVLGNPAIEATVIPRGNAPTRAQLKLLVAEELMPRVVVAANAYFAQDLERRTAAGADGAFGMTGGLSYALLPGLLHVGVEGQLGEAQYGLANYYLVAALGPDVVLHRGPFALTASVMANLAPALVSIEPKVTLGFTY